VKTITKNMKKYIKPMGLLASSAILFTGMLCQADTISILVPTPSGGGVTDITIADTITVVPDGLSPTGLEYTYSYSVSNPLGDNDVVESFEVNANRALVFNQVGGLAGSRIDAGGVTWDITTLTAGNTASGFSYQSFYGPHAGTDDANDSVTWNSNVAGGTPTEVPNVPDGGLTVALLGGSLIALQAFNRKKAKS
jgi:hypothetical protein